MDGKHRADYASDRGVRLLEKSGKDGPGWWDGARKSERAGSREEWAQVTRKRTARRGGGALFALFAMFPL